jgi:hypothetical protein
VVPVASDLPQKNKGNLEIKNFLLSVICLKESGEQILEIVAQSASGGPQIFHLQFSIFNS